MMMVSVCMTTYNQERYIGEAIESVLRQETSFPIELVIGDDCSSDNTTAICEEYAELYSNVFVHTHGKNRKGLARNLAAIWAECKGKYIAIFEGDDYWLSVNKLQAQVDYMEAHPEWAMCFTTTMVRDSDGNERVFPYPIDYPDTLNISTIIRHNIIANCSVMYRAGIVPHLPHWMKQLPYCDIALHCLHAQHGPIGFVPDVVSVYRLHNESAFEHLSFMERVNMSTAVYKAMGQYLKVPYRYEARQTLAMMYFGLALHNTRQPMKALRFIQQGLSTVSRVPLKHMPSLVPVAIEALSHTRLSR